MSWHKSSSNVTLDLEYPMPVEPIVLPICSSSVLATLRQQHPPRDAHAARFKTRFQPRCVSCATTGAHTHTLVQIRMLAPVVAHTRLNNVQNHRLHRFDFLMEKIPADATAPEMLARAAIVPISEGFEYFRANRVPRS